MKKPIKSEMTMKFWVTRIHSKETSKAVEAAFLASLKDQCLELSWKPADVKVDANRGLITIESPYPELNCDDTEFIYHIAQDWENAIDAVNQSKRELKELLETPIKTKPQAVIYIGRLHELDCGYHMDDDATELGCFGESLGKLANKSADECFELLTNDEYCPHAVGLACFMD
jgi:hypothetical protein